MERILDRISCHNFVEIDGYAYFSNWFYNGFFKVEIETGKTFFLGFFENEDLSERNIHKEILLKDGKIYFFPRRGRYVHIYNVKSQEMCAVEIRKESERFFLIKDVVIGEKYIVFIPEQKQYLNRVLELNLLKVTIENKDMNYLGKYMSKSKDIFPDIKFLNKYYPDYSRNFFWKKRADGIWYSFEPTGCQIIQYKDGKSITIPLFVVNKETIEKYLYEVRVELLKKGSIFEKRIQLQEFLECVEMCKEFRQYFDKFNCVGKDIWKLVVDLNI